MWESQGAVLALVAYCSCAQSASGTSVLRIRSGEQSEKVGEICSSQVGSGTRSYSSDWSREFVRLESLWAPKYPLTAGVTSVNIMLNTC